jgi:hypothetical protein
MNDFIILLDPAFRKYRLTSIRDVRIFISCCSNKQVHCEKENIMTRKPRKQNGNIYNIKGSIRAGRDVIMGDQNIDIQNIANIKSTDQFVEELGKLQVQIAELRQNLALKPTEKRSGNEANVEKALISKKPVRMERILVRP